jgi:hypothetical protein
MVFAIKRLFFFKLQLAPHLALGYLIFEVIMLFVNRARCFLKLKSVA